MIDLNEATLFALRLIAGPDGKQTCPASVRTVAILGSTTFEVQSGGLLGWLMNCAGVQEVLDTKAALERIGDTQAALALDEILGHLPRRELPADSDTLVSLGDQNQARWLEVERMLPSPRLHALLQAYVDANAADFGSPDMERT
ncbi:MAG: hypothetical protein HOO96_37630 [Polyangiaceae bacterium]|nr:hypothetical protein [Polyangiaceae bacterium]